MTEEILSTRLDEARQVDEPVFRHLDRTTPPELRTIESMAGLLNLDQQTVRFAVNRLERNGRIFGEDRRWVGGLETWRTDNTPPPISQVVF